MKKLMMVLMVMATMISTPTFAKSVWGENGRPDWATSVSLGCGAAVDESRLFAENLIKLGMTTEPKIREFFSDKIPLGVARTSTISVATSYLKGIRDKVELQRRCEKAVYAFDKDGSLTAKEMGIMTAEDEQIASEKEIADEKKAEEQKTFEESDIGQLKKTEADVAKLKTEIAKKEKEVATLGSELMAMKSRFGTAAAGPNDTLEGMTAIADKKDSLTLNIDNLKKQLASEDNKKRKAEIEKDITNYEKIANSPSMKDMIPAAWNSLVTKYASVEGIKKVGVGDKRALRNLLMPPPQVLKIEKYDFRCYDDVVIDTKTGLMWTKNSNIADKAMSWNEAMEWAKNLDYAGYTDWRLPTAEELNAFMGRRGDKLQQFKELGFVNLDEYSGYWSSTLCEDNSNHLQSANSWNVNRTECTPPVIDKIGKHYYSDYFVWPVRAGQ